MTFLFYSENVWAYLYAEIALKEYIKARVGFHNLNPVHKCEVLFFLEEILFILFHVCCLALQACSAHGGQKRVLVLHETGVSVGCDTPCRYWGSH